MNTNNIKKVSNKVELQEWYNFTKGTELENILRTVTKRDLINSFKLISAIPVRTSSSKEDIYYLIKNQFDNMERTKDLSKNLL